MASKICCYNVLLPGQTIMCASAAAESRGRAIGRQNIAKLLSNRYIYEKWERRNTRSKPIDKPFLPFSVFARGSRYLIRRNFFYNKQNYYYLYMKTAFRLLRPRRRPGSSETPKPRTRKAAESIEIMLSRDALNLAYFVV